MFCNTCGTEILEGHSFCGKCGKSASGWLEEAVQKPKKGLSPVTWAAIALLAVILCGMVIASLSNQSSPPKPDTGAQQRPAIHIPVIRHETQELLSGSHIVQPHQYVTYPITIAPEMRNARLSGRFTATGGVGNDLQALITDEDGLLNFKNGHQAKVYYQSGKVTADSFDVRLGPGTYYLVFNNAFSVLSNKAYDADVKLDFDHEVVQ